MSYVAWHTRDHGTVELRGSENAHAGGVCRDIALGLLRLPADYKKAELVAHLVDPPDYVRKWGLPENHQFWASGLRTWLSVDGAVLLDGEPMPFGDLALNTAITMNRPLRLLAWMAGTCENHGYFEGAAKSALLETISEGLEAKILREGAGWEKVSALITKASGPIVWSYSVGEGFPDPWVLDGTPDPDDQVAVDAWEEKWYVFDGETDESRRKAGKPTQGEIWDMCMEHLRAQKWPVALHPDIEQGYRSGKTVFDFLAQLDAA